jgi:cytochrome c553
MRLKQEPGKHAGAGRPLVIGALLGMTLIALLGVAYGPDLLGYYRFSQAVQQASEESQATSGPWPQFNAVCSSCHGATGQSLDQFYPSLAGQPQSYLTQQLQAFASGQRSNPTMSSLAINLSQARIEQLAAFYAALPATPNTAFRPDPQRREHGKRLVDQYNCGACHGNQLQGQAAYPRLAGQGYEYLVTQLGSYKAGSRKDTAGVMTAMAAPFNDEDIINMATYLASY